MSIERWKLTLAVVVTLGLLALSVPWGADLGWAYLADRQYALADTAVALGWAGRAGSAGGSDPSAKESTATAKE